MTRCKQKEHLIRIRYERRPGWRFWRERIVVFCVWCDLEIKDPFGAS